MWKVYLFSGVFLPITFALGLWQLDRAEYKELRQEQLSQTTNLPALPLEDLDGAPQPYRHYRISGRLSDKTFLLDNRIREGRVGYEVLTLFETDAGEGILVNRGWVPASPRRETLPDIPGSADVVKLQGYFYLPDGQLPVLAEGIDALNGNWPRRIQRIEWSGIEQTLGRPLVAHQEFRLSEDTEAISFTTGWPLVAGKPAKHYGYAFQWFALCLALLLLTVWLALHSRNENRRQSNIEDTRSIEDQ